MSLSNYNKLFQNIRNNDYLLKILKSTLMKKSIEAMNAKATNKKKSL